MENSIFVVMETAGGAIKNVGLEMLSPAKEIAAAKGLKTAAVIIGSGVDEAAKQAANYGADCVITVDAPEYETYSSDEYAAALAQLCEKYSPEAVFIGATPNGKDLAPRVAAKLNTGCAADAVGVKLGDDGKIVFTCPVFGGNILADNVIDTRPQMGTIRGGVFKKAEVSDASANVVKETVTLKDCDVKTKIADVVKEISESVNLEDAEVIVAGGRGMGSPENFALVKELADLLGGVV